MRTTDEMAMRIVLSKDGVKREIIAPFAICISAQDLDILIAELTRLRGYMGASTYSWLRFDPSNPCDCPSDTYPKEWTE